MNDIKRIIQRLSNSNGISGYEDSVREVLRGEIGKYVDEIREDALGNLITVKNAQNSSESLKYSKKKVMLAAHMDEIGLMAKYIDEKGFIRFVEIGGWFDQSLLNTRVVLHGEKGPILGVIGSKPPHVMKKEDEKKPIKLDDMFIDIGAKNEKEVDAAGIKRGTPITLDMASKDLLNNRITGKAFDNRAGLTVMIEAMKRVRAKCTIYAVGTVQEEVGLKGARTSAFGLDPDLALAIDTTIPGDHPGIEKKESPIEVDKGPAITVADASGRGLLAPKKVIEWLTETAEDNNIPYQLDVSAGGTTDATAIHLTRAGIPSSVISIPTRYIHSQVEVLSLDDINNCAELIARSLENIERYFNG